MAKKNFTIRHSYPVWKTDIYVVEAENKNNAKALFDLGEAELVDQEDGDTLDLDDVEDEIEVNESDEVYVDGDEEE